MVAVPFLVGLEREVGAAGMGAPWAQRTQLKSWRAGSCHDDV